MLIGILGHTVAWHEGSEDVGGRVDALELLASLAVHSGELGESQALVAEASALRRSTGYAVLPIYKPWRDNLCGAVLANGG